VNTFQRAIAVDTNLLINPTPRRLITAGIAQVGGTVIVTPTVDFQVRKNLITTTRKEVQRWFRRLPPENEPKRHEIEQTAVDSATDWWIEEGKRNDSIYVMPSGDRDLANRITHEQRRLPEKAFDDDDQWDLVITAEAIALGVPLLVSQNFRFVDKELLEKEAKANRCGWVKLLHLKEFFEQVRDENETATQCAFQTVVRAVRRNAPVSREQLQGSARRFINNLKEAEKGWSKTEKISDELDQLFTEASPVQWKEWCELPLQHRVRQARETEKRFHERQRKTVRATGYDPWARS